MIGEYLLEDIARIPSEVEYASEFRYRRAVVEPGTIAIPISQSGETADTLWAMREAKQQGATTLGIVNAVGSTIPRETDAGVYLHAGPEIGVASTKAFTSQVVVLAMITVHLGRLRGTLTQSRGREIVRALRQLPEQVAEILKMDDEIKKLAEQYKDSKNFLYLGRGYNFPAALEGALKLKEISYIHAEGYPAAEMKHGPIALIDENMPVVVIAPRDAVYDKVRSNIDEVKARGGCIIAVISEDDDELEEVVDHVIRIPRTHDALTPILASRAAAAAGVPHRRAARRQRGPAAQPGEERDGGVGGRPFRDLRWRLRRQWNACGREGCVRAALSCFSHVYNSVRNCPRSVADNSSVVISAAILQLSALAQPLERVRSDS